jgi:hypothetical protein
VLLEDDAGSYPRAGLLRPWNAYYRIIDADVSELGPFPAWDVWVEPQEEGGTRVTRPLFSFATAATATHSTFLLMDNGEPWYRVYSDRGALLRVVRLGIELEPISRSDIDLALEGRLQGVPVDRMANLRSRLLRIPRPPNLPTVHTAPRYPYFIHADELGRTWVRTGARRDGSSTWTVIDASEATSAFVRFPDPVVTILDVMDQLVLAVWFDHNDVEHVAVYRFPYGFALREPV